MKRGDADVMVRVVLPIAIGVVVFRVTGSVYAGLAACAVALLGAIQV